MATRDTFRGRLSRGGLVGSWLMLDLPEVVEIMGVAGFDFVFVDLERGQVFTLSRRPPVARKTSRPDP